MTDTPMTQEEKAALALRAQAGDAVAASALVEQMRGFIYQEVRRRLRHTDRFEADDLVSEVVLYLLSRRFKGYDPDRGAVTTWLRWTIHWVISDIFRGSTRSPNKRKLLNALEFSQLVAEDGDFDVADYRDQSTREGYQDSLAYLSKLLDRLPPGRQLVTYLGAAGEQQKDIAETLGTSRQAVNQLQLKTRKLLQEIMICFVNNKEKSD